MTTRTQEPMQTKVKTKAVITILGTLDKEKAECYFSNELKSKIESKSTKFLSLHQIVVS